ncbi:TonB-dependent receptor [Pontibacter diazotrophicus]|uniref:TonB-dependent receptor n=1 Tax=Pontibacter diazotrophicus TaxID=1400979 RepID=A0A3D8LD91_9BACT|nr:TonB-dependent receptor [Pontibacter diazotrophicus]RDV15313.1 TonB-dependent receptor [Pontibacter diazotrophicus]
MGRALLRSGRHMLTFLLMLFSVATVLAQSATVSGRVTDENGDGLPGVTVLVKGTTNGTATGADGAYTLPVTTSDATLVFSFIGYQPQEVQVNNRSTVNVSLAPDSRALEEVVVIGYGTVKKSDLTGSVASVRGEDLTAIPVTNGLEVMQGKVPGLDLTRTSGQAGAGLNFNIRGNRSVNASNQPLILVDGIRYDGPLDVNPNDIASMEVLKDATATAIYGSLGANGVILITTKSGAAGKTRVTLNSYYGIQTRNGYADIMTGPEWVQLRREARRTVGEWDGPEDDERILPPAQFENFQNGIWTEWGEELIGTGSQQNHQIGVSGGSDKINYYFSTEYFNEKGLLANDQLERYSGRMNIGYNLLDNLKLSTNLMYTYRDRDIRRDPLNQANKMSPLGAPYDAEGNLVTFPVGDASTLNPLVDEQPGNYENNDVNRRFFGNLSLDYTPIENLTLTSRFGIDQSNNRNGLFAATNTIETGPNGLSLARAELGNFSRFTWENFANYNKTLSENHELSATLGTSIWSERTEFFSAQGRDLLSSTLLFYNLGATQTAFQLNSSLVERSMASFFGRVNYKLFNKYLFTGVLRTDGSSVLAEGRKWDYFPSASVGWLLKEENFLRDVNFISDLKLRLSYGISGNSQIDPYLTLGGLGRSTYAFDQGTAESPAYGYYPGALPNPNLTWETTATANAGLDFGLFYNRVVGTLDVYQQNTRDLLLERNLPTTTGYERVIDNVGETRNRGVELQLGTINLDQPNGIRWSTDVSFARNKEEVVKLADGVERDLSFGDYGLHVGQPLNVFYDYEKIGIWQSGEEDAAAVNQQNPGDIRVRDQDGDGVITPEDRIVIGNETPDWTLGVTNRLGYKGLELSFMVYARIGQTIISEAAGSYKVDGLENGPMVDYWTPENPTNAYPRPNAGTSRSSTRYYSTLQYVDGSFVKMRDITLAYTFPNAISERLKLARLRAYVTAKNYFILHSEIAPYDPERGGALSFPMTKQMVFGLNLEF